uniref:Uncharacterized protein n=1 Tax=Schistocephalus solidus TaxID=70667 RepID=A0A0X3Q424_SCHSO
MQVSILVSPFYDYFRNLLEAIDLQKFVHRLQSSNLPSKKINSLLCCFTEELISQFDNELENTAPFEGYFSKATFTPFPNVDSAWHQLFIQLLLTVPGNDLIQLLQKLLASKESASKLRWNILLPLVSCLAVCVKGSAHMLRDLLRQVLVSVFSNEPTPAVADDDAEGLLEEDSLSDADEEDLDDKAWFCGIAGDPVADSSQVDSDCRLKAALLLARQLFSEDSRVVGCTYRQWWAEHFASTPSSLPNGGTGVLSSRRSVAYLARELTSLLPFEMNPVFLRTQISVIPFWVSSQRATAATRGDSVNASTELVVEDGEQWLETWMDYVDIARGRLAELRCGEQSPSATSTLEMPSASTKHWTEVHALLQEYSVQTVAASSSSEKVNSRLPAYLVEMSLFRPRFFQETFLPLLQRPPPGVNLPASLDAARVLLLEMVEQHLHVKRPQTSRLVGSSVAGRRVRKRKKT